MCDAGGASARPARCPLTTWTAARPSTKGRTPEPVGACTKEREMVVVGSITGWGAVFQCDVDADRCWRSRPSKRQRPPKQERRRVGVSLRQSTSRHPLLRCARPPIPAASPREAGRDVAGCRKIPRALSSFCEAAQPPRGQSVLSRPSYCAGAPRPLRSRRAVLLVTACRKCARRALVLGQPPSVGRF